MKPLRVFVADVDQGHIDQIRAVLKGRRDMVFTGSARDGNAAFDRLISAPADVLILDLQLPGMSGGTLMRALKKMGSFPMCIVCTRFYSELSVECACKSGAIYFLYKPLNYRMLPDLLLTCCRARRSEPSPVHRSRAEEAGVIARALKRLGFVASLCGTVYLVEALIRLRSNASLLRNLSKGLYADIAAGMGATPACVERGMRNAIAIAFERGSLRQCFDSRPTNRQFFEFTLGTLEDGEWDE